MVQTELKDGKYQFTDKSKTARSNPLVQALETLYGTHRRYVIVDKYIRALKSEEKIGKLNIITC